MIYLVDNYCKGKEFAQGILTGEAALKMPIDAIVFSPAGRLFTIKKLNF
jgi:hypothetical protein